MNYFFDLLINLNDTKAYEFYEWEESDEIIHLKKIPIFKISEAVLNLFLTNNIQVDKAFLEKIYMQTESYKPDSKIEYMALFTTDTSCLILEFDHNGNSLYRSKLLLEEELDLLELVFNLKTTNINYSIINPLNIDQDARQIKKVNKILTQEIDVLFASGNKDKLKYLYYEVSNKTLDDIKKLKSELLKLIKSDFSNSHLKLYNIIKLSYKHLST